MRGRNFSKCNSGNVAMLFALSLLPLMGAVGTAVDYSMASNLRSQLQNSIDSAALTLAQSDSDLTEAELQAKAEELVAHNFQNSDRVSVDAVLVTRTKGSVEVTASAEVATTFLKALSVNSIAISTSGQAVWGATNGGSGGSSGASQIEIALVLDNTKSMDSSDKMDQLKEAATQLVDMLEEAATDEGSVKIALVPFATSVRVTPKTYKTAEWVRFDDISYTEEVCTGKGRNKKCHDEVRTRAFQKSGWDGCIQDRDKPNDIEDTAYDKNKAETLYPAVESCPSGEDELQTVLPLTTNFDKVRTAIDDMEPAGSTNVTIGVAWGMTVLSSQAPFTEGTPPNTEGVKKFMIVLTDGENTRNRFTSNSSQIDARTKLACQKARDLGTVFSVRVIEGNEDLLEDCASEDGGYFNVEDADDLVPVFESIASKITRLRLAS